MGCTRRGAREAAALFWLIACFALWPMGCSQDVGRGGAPAGTPPIRVLLLENQQRVNISATGTPTVRIGPQTSGRQLHFPPGASVAVSLTPAGWQFGSALLGVGEMVLEPSSDGSVRVGDHAYHGRYRFVPVGPNRFDVVNDVDMESYLKGVLAAELYPNWHEEAFKAQAIVARTYALYESHTAGLSRYFDVFNDQRSQVYGGIAAETRRSIEATEATGGIVVAFGPAGHETIFKSYFSSCCGGITQSAADAFGDSLIQPLTDQRHAGCCVEAPHFNWGPIILSKAEITRRMRAWGNWKKRLEKDVGPIVRIDLSAVSRLGRPVRFIVTDARGQRYSLRAEELREAVNTDAGSGPKIFSSFCKLIDEGGNIRFADGHGYGHGVGMCQWCAEHQAAQGWNDESIVLSAFPGAKLIRAY